MGRVNFMLFLTGLNLLYSKSFKTTRVTQGLYEFQLFYAPTKQPTTTTKGGTGLWLRGQKFKWSKF
jgi:hypothetical protein